MKCAPPVRTNMAATPAHTACGQGGEATPRKLERSGETGKHGDDDECD